MVDADSVMACSFTSCYKPFDSICSKFVALVNLFGACSQRAASLMVGVDYLCNEVLWFKKNCLCSVSCFWTHVK